MIAILKEDQPAFKLKKDDRLEVELITKEHKGLGIDVGVEPVYKEQYRVIDCSYYLPVEDLKFK